MLRHNNNQQRASLLLLLLHFLLIITATTVNQPSATTHADKSLTICEDGLASLHCDAQQEIVIKRAVFGRFTLNVCNPDKKTDLPTDCGNESRTVEKMRDSCDKRQWCTVTPSVHLFFDGVDPCKGKSKYLEVHWTCVPATTAAGVTTTTSTTTLSTNAFVPKVVEANATGTVPKFVGGHGVGNGHKNNNNNKIIVGGCPALKERDLSWPMTVFGQTARVECPHGTIGHAEWHCSAMTNQWSTEEGPNLANCTSDWTHELRRENRDDEMGSVTSQERRENLLETLREIYEKLRHADRLYGGDARVVANLLAHFTEREQRQEISVTTTTATKFGTMVSLDGGRHPQQQMKRTKAREEVLAIAKLIIQSTGHLLRTNQRSAWADLSIEGRQVLAQQLLTTVPKALSLLLPFGISETLLAEPTLNCELTQAVKIYDSVPFPSMRTYRDVDIVQLSRDALEVYNKDYANVYYMVWDQSMGNFLLGTNNINADDENSFSAVGQPNQRHRHFHQKHHHRHVQTHAIARLVGISVVPLNAQLHVHPINGRPILIIFRNDLPITILRHQKIVGEPRCVWWNPSSSRFVGTIDEHHHQQQLGTANTGGTGADASAKRGTAGCTLQERNRTHTVCQCQHMNTHFTVVADFEDRTNAAALDGWGSKILPFSSPLVYALFRLGALIASVCLLIAFLITLLIRPRHSSKSDAIKIGIFGGHSSWHRCHITAILLLIQIILLNTFHEIYQHQSLCLSIALLLQYLVLAALCWTLLDALQMRDVALHLHDHTTAADLISTTLLKQIILYFFGYGFPLLLIGATFIVQNWHKNVPPASSSLSEFCWLNLDFFGIYTFVGPVALLLWATIFCLAHSFFAMNSARNLKSCLSSDAYHPCSNGIKNMHTNKQREQRRQRLNLRQRVQWLSARCALSCTECSAAVCWAYFVRLAIGEDETGVEDGIGIDTLALVANSALTFSLLNTALGVQVLTEIVVDKMTRAHYRRWRLGGGGFGPISAFFTGLVDKLCCCGTFILKKPSQNGIGAEFPQLKFAFSPSGAVLLENVNGCGGPNSSATSSSSGRNGGTASACSEISTTELPVSSSGDSALLAHQQQTLAPSLPPPPAALLQLYHEHKRKNSSSSTSTKTKGGGAGNKNNNDQPTSLDNTNNYDYATIPYDDLSFGKQPTKATCCYRMPPPTTAQASAGYSMTPRQTQHYKKVHGGRHSARGHSAGNNNYGGHSPYTYTPQIVRMQHNNQVQLIHPDLPIQQQQQASASNNNICHHHIIPSAQSAAAAADEHYLYQQQQQQQQMMMMMRMMDMPAGEMGANSILPPPPSSATAPYALHSSVVHFRRPSSSFRGNPPMMMVPSPQAPSNPSSSLSARASSTSGGGGGGTVVFKMDLSRPEPVFSERIDSLDEIEDGEGDEEEEEEEEEDEQ